MQTAKELVKNLHQEATIIESAPELVILPDNTVRLFTGGRMPAGATKGSFIGALPKTLTAATGATGLPGPARARSNGRSTANGRRTTAARRAPARSRTG